MRPRLKRFSLREIRCLRIDSKFNPNISGSSIQISILCDLSAYPQEASPEITPASFRRLGLLLVAAVSVKYDQFNCRFGHKVKMPLV